MMIVMMVVVVVVRPSLVGRGTKHVMRYVRQAWKKQETVKLILFLI